ncbi:MAG: hypothetical protein JW745_08205 [Sedimentisphaerales bacterium]|nr:hypothetical protein [Sedimentisphaerales bacterium]MBN2842938.1 hypothetical protein [Sedimentisphaerales bacterium]
MKKTVIFLAGIVFLAGCSNEEMIQCRMERQSLQLEVDQLNQKLADANLVNYQDKTNSELKIASLESTLTRARQQLVEAQSKISTELPELQEAYNNVKEQLEMANNALREELAKTLAFQGDLQALRDEVKRLTELLANKEELLKQANAKLAELAAAVTAAPPSAVVEQPAVEAAQ